MRSLRHPLTAPEPFQVLSLNVQARLAKPARIQSQFEVLVRHLFDRLLNNEAFGEDAALQAAQLAYAIALPGLLVALFLFPAYHHPPPYHLDRGFWSQACDHLFYVVYSFVILGIAIVFQWDLLFPDLLDVNVLSALPIERTRLLLGRISALTIFLALVEIGTSGLGALFLPAVADLRCGFWRHFAAHAAAVTLAGLFTAVFFLALQSLLVCLPAYLARKALPIAKALSIVALLTILFLFPLLAHYLSGLLGSTAAPLRWFPPFWFLGVYECLLWPHAALPIFHQLACTGLSVTAALAAAGAALYPLAYARQVRRLSEGAPLRRNGSPLPALLRRILHATILRDPGSRATFHFASASLFRLPRLQLYLAMYAGVGLALAISGLLVLVIHGSHVRLAISPYGVRLALPLLVFWTVAGLRTALRSPIGRQGSWLFRSISGTPRETELRGALALVRLSAILLTLVFLAVLHLIAPAAAHGPIPSLAEVILTVGLSVVLTGLFFLPVRTLPFTDAPRSPTQELPLILVRYMVLFPAFTLTMASLEPWIELSPLHLLLTALGFLAIHLAVSRARTLLHRYEDPAQAPLYTELGLRQD